MFGVSAMKVIGRLPLVRAAALLVVALFVTGAPVRAAELVMFESDTCGWCALWNKQIGVVYAKTSEGRVLPLRRVDVDEDRPADLADVQPVIYTPTFVVINGGREVGRILGYPGEDFFWPMLGEIIGRMGQSADRRSGS